VFKSIEIKLARKEEIEQIEEIIAGSNYLQDDTLSSIKSIMVYFYYNKFA